MFVFKTNFLAFFIADLYIHSPIRLHGVVLK
jgi:hypothetical protein